MFGSHLTTATGSDPKGLARAARSTRLALSVVIAASLLLSAGCAEQRDPIDRVQPYALKKADFAGEWYYQRTVVDVPAANGFTFVGNTDHSGLQKVKFDIQEKVLYVRRNVELIKGGDDKAAKGQDYEGEGVAAFPIVKHFDIRRAYNPTTGEELNVLEENAIDRPWYEREYIRVDWSKNNVTNYQLDFESKSIEPVPYVPQQTEDGAVHPDAPHFDFAGEGKWQRPYFDITSKIFAKAGTFEYPGYGTIPVCWLMGEETTECGSGEYAIRHSFLKLDAKHQYVPQPYKGAETDMFGFFTSDRLVYDNKLGIKQQNKERFLQRHNIWQQWTKADGTPIPEAERTPRPIVYHVNAEFPEDLKDVARKVASQWNGVFKDAVKATGNPYDGDMFILCENHPVAEGDPAECGKVGDAPRLGDIRYSFIAWVPKYMKYGLLGLGPSNNDPETGEIISGMAYMYHHNNTAAWRTVEMIELLNGARESDDFVEGLDLTDWIAKVNQGQSRFEYRSLSEAKTMVDRIANSVFSKYWEGRRTKITQADVDFQHKHGHHAWAHGKLQTMYDAGHLNGLGNSAEARLDRVKGTPLEKQLLHPELKMAAGFAPDAKADEALLDAVSPVRGGFMTKVRDRARIRQEIAASRNMYLPEMLDDALMGLAKEVKGKTSDEIYQIVREAVYTAVFAHEVGHSLGLMHNFGGSDDAVNYFDGYWKLRDDGKVGPRLQDPITDKEIDGKIYNYAYSSVMDYAGRLTIDGLGVGKYDRAAILYGYARKVEVFKDPGNSPGIWKKWFDGRSEILDFFILGPQATHYTTIYKGMGPKMYEASNRQLVDVTTLTKDLSQAKVGDQTYYRVPYVYCTHGRSDLSDSCLTRDFGADSSERMKHFLDEWDTWYITRAFVRGNLGVTNQSYANRYYGRIYNRIKQWHDIYGLYAAFLPQFYAPNILEAFFTDPVNGWGGNTWAVQNAFQYLVETILMPDVGAYGAAKQADGTTLLKTGGFGGGNLSLGITDARYYSTSWSFPGQGGRNCGYFWYECLQRIGFYVDKVMAMMAISDSRTNFVARANPIDIREWHVSYYNTFSQSIRAINAAIQSGDWSRVGPYKDSSGKIRFPTYSGKLDAVHADAIDPAADFTVQLYFSLLGQANFMTNYDRDFIEEAQVWVEGTWKSPALPAEATVSFTDPQSGLVYGALNKAGGAGAAMLAHANKLRSRSTSCDGTSQTATKADDCASGLSKQEVAAADADLKKYVQLLKSVADMSFAMSYGHPLNP